MTDVIKILLFVFSCGAFACDYPDEGNMPLRRAVTRVQMLPEIDAWAKAIHRTGVVTQYAILLDQPVREAGRCYWPLEVRASGNLWRRYLVTPDGKALIGEGVPKAAASPPAASKPAAPTPAAR